MKNVGALRDLGLKSKRRFSKDILVVVLMLLPGLTYLIINNYLPMYGLTIAFRDIDYSVGIFNSPWNNFENFEFLFQTDEIWLYIRNTILYNVVFIVLGIVVPIALAILFSNIRNKISKRIYQTCILLPFLMSWVVVSYIAYAFLSYENGFFNSIITSLGGQKIDFYMEGKYWPFILVFFNIWKSIGYNFLFYYAAILAINPSYYEAAKLDGASYWQQLRKITIPCIKTTIVTMFILGIAKVLNSDYGLFYVVTKQCGGGALYDATMTLDSYIFVMVRENANFTQSSAAGLLQALIGFILVVSANAILRKVDPESSLF